MRAADAGAMTRGGPAADAAHRPRLRPELTGGALPPDGTDQSIW